MKSGNAPHGAPVGTGVAGVHKDLRLYDAR